jgi:bifunctional UDP-N-acetylglucosamine pyrophosphorylase/glucosamine-1-phosphate N-acetyltransferase
VAPLQVVVLAAGQGKRMRSELPKVLHPLAGRPLLEHVLAAARTLSPSRLCVVVGHGGQAVRQAMDRPGLAWATQEPQLGTGHAVMQALPELEPDGTVLVLYGDVPLIGGQTLRALVDAAAGGALAILTQKLDSPQGYGRIVRDATGRVTRIVEEKDATADERAITEVNTGILAISRARLDTWLAALRNDNAQREYYLTDVVGAAVREGVEIAVRHPASAHECIGVNSKGELARLERLYQMTKASELLEAGVTLADPARIDVRGELTCGRDVSIDINCIFEGRVSLADGARIGAGCILRDVAVGAAHAGEPLLRHRGGPDRRQRADRTLCAHPPGTRLDDEVHVGNFVEVKASTLGHGSKANHLSYIGDSTVGRDVNVGAGTITCNYDGAHKHRTVIEDDVHIGSDVQLIAPVTVGKGSTIAAGATIMKDVPPGGLTLTEAKQVTRSNWQRPRKK